MQKPSVEERERGVSLLDERFLLDVVTMSLRATHLSITLERLPEWFQSHDRAQSLLRVGAWAGAYYAVHRATYALSLVAAPKGKTSKKFVATDFVTATKAFLLSHHMIFNKHLAGGGGLSAQRVLDKGNNNSHNCQFDYANANKKLLEKQNPKCEHAKIIHF